MMPPDLFRLINAIENGRGKVRKKALELVKLREKVTERALDPKQRAKAWEHLSALHREWEEQIYFPWEAKQAV